MSSPEHISFASNAAMAEKLADFIAAELAVAIGVRGTASLAVSGGSTPAMLHRVLSERDVDWSKVTVFLVDDRWVAPGSKGSNESFVFETLLIGKAAAATYISLWHDTETPSDALETVSARFDGLTAPIDVVVLGMGPDGHTASWFPHAEGLANALESDELFATVTANRSDVTGDHLMRMTLTLNAVKSARRVALLMAGEGKKSAFDAACQNGPVEDMPVRAILNARPDLWVAWSP